MPPLAVRRSRPSMPNLLFDKPGIPILFVHIGYKDVVDIALRQAALAAPDSPVILLTDEIRDLPFAVHQADIRLYTGSYPRFDAVYEHLSVNGEGYEAMCYGRWFFAHEFAVRHGLGRFCVFDSDVMLYRPAERFAAAFAGRIAGNWSWANCFEGPEALGFLCDRFVEIFADKPRLHALADRFRIGGRPHVSDMHLLMEIAAADPRFLEQGSLIAQGFDHNIRDADGCFAMCDGLKSVRFGADGIPVCARTDGGAPVPFTFLHFQGPAKDRMGRFAWPAAGQPPANWPPANRPPVDQPPVD